jgi:type I restriction enzyme R subunit
MDRVYAMKKTSEAQLEQHVLDHLQDIGYSYKHGDSYDPEVSPAERPNYHAAILSQTLRTAVGKINPSIPQAALDSAVHQVLDVQLTELLQENRRLHRLLVEGVPVEYHRAGETVHDRAWLIDWTSKHNQWLAVNQLVVVGANKRRPDIVLFLNGIPVVVIELKAPESAVADSQAAFNQIQTYKADIPALFRTNAISVISDGFSASFGTLSASFDRFMCWRTEDGTKLVAPKSVLAIETLVRGLLRPEVLLPMIQHFTVFEDDGVTAIKKCAGYHQYYAALRGLEKVKQAVRSDGKAGVIWHTQGSGKSLLMAFFAGLLVRDPQLKNPTLLILTDRNDLDGQLFGTFSRCKDLFGQIPEQVENVGDLRKRLDRQVGGVIFSTIQKFRPESGETTFPVINKRKNLIVFVDEAHRSQYGFGAKVDAASGKKTYGFAHYLRQALPSATFVGFTGTPVDLVDRNTKAIFGEYIDVYDISRAVEDGATVPIYYEGKIVRLAIPEAERLRLDAEFEEITEDMEDTEKAQVGGRWSRLESLAGADKRLDELARLIVDHFQKRQAAMLGKGMIVCMSRRVCAELYNRLVKLKPEWHHADHGQGYLKVVMTGSAADPPLLQPHVRNQAQLDLLARRFRDPKDDFRLVIVRDMWLTGFDSPSMHTLYVDKPMRGHTLMQAIARVNRIFRDKPAGLVVDTIGIATDLKEALAVYSDPDRHKTGIDGEKAAEALAHALDVMRGMFHGLNYRPALSGDSALRMKTLAAAAGHVLALEASSGEPTTKERKSGKKRFFDAASALEKAFKLASGRPEAEEAKDEVAFFLAVRVVLRKLDGDSGPRKTEVEIDSAISRLINQAVASTEIIDLLKASGHKQPDISVLSDKFLEEMKGLNNKNLAVEALRRLLSGEITSRTRTNVVRNRQFSERLEQAMAKYHNRVIDALRVIEELIHIAKDLREEPEDGLTDEEASLYDALADNTSAVEVMGNEKLRIIASELVKSIRNKAGVDWWMHENRRAAVRVAVRRILRKYGYPPDLQDSAIKTVVQQAEALATEISSAQVDSAVV